MSHENENRKMVFAEQLRAIMSSRKTPDGKKLTQQHIADAVHVQRETVSRWVRGISCPLENERTMAALCAFLCVPPEYFTKNYYLDGWTMFDRETHDSLNEACIKVGKKTGLKDSFVQFLKETPALADAVIRASSVDEILQSMSPNVPEMKDHLYQFISSTGVKIYPSRDVLNMLRLIQRDTEDYIQYLFLKYGRVYEKYQAEVQEALRKPDAGKTPKRLEDIFGDMLRGREDLSTEENHMLDMFRRISDEGKTAVRSALVVERKRHPAKKKKNK